MVRSYCINLLFGVLLLIAIFWFSIFDSLNVLLFATPNLSKFVQDFSKDSFFAFGHSILFFVRILLSIIFVFTRNKFFGSTEIEDAFIICVFPSFAIFFLWLIGAILSGFSLGNVYLSAIQVFKYSL